VLSFLSESGSGEVAAGSGVRQVYRALLPVLRSLLPQ
jgi:hypothetical protein